MISLDVWYVDLATIYKTARGDAIRMCVQRGITSLIPEPAQNAFHLARLVIQLE